jgi:hypothetical protein
MEESQLPSREASVEEYNATHRHRKRGFAAVPCKFGVCFEPTFLNQVQKPCSLPRSTDPARISDEPFMQAPALVQVLLDGSVQLFHGGVEMVFVTCCWNRHPGSTCHCCDRAKGYTPR